MDNHNYHTHHNISGHNHSERYGGKKEAHLNAHSGHSIIDFQRRFYVSLIATVPILVLSPFIQDMLGFSLTFMGDSYLLFLLASFIFFYGGWPFLSGAAREIKYRNIGMMVLISLAIIVAYFYSSAVVFGLPGEVFFWELATLIDIMLLGHWIEMKSIMGASMALEKLSALIPDKANLVRGKEIVEIETALLKEGDIILVKPGEKIPSDGIVLEGESFVNESMLTGEAAPVSKVRNGKVIGGSINEEGFLKIIIKGTREDSYLSKVIKLVKTAQASKSRTQALADKAAFWLTIAAIAAGFATFVVWFFMADDVPFAIERTATVLVIACPHALGLAIPLVAAVSTILSARRGLLIKNSTAFENARKISTVIFDKTGTLTEGKFEVKEIFPEKGWSEDRLLTFLAGLEQYSEHPISRAVAEEAARRKLTIPRAGRFRAMRGKGVEGEMLGRKIAVASPGYAKELGVEIPGRLIGVKGTMVYLIVLAGRKNILAGAVNLADGIRQESFEAVKALKSQGIKVWMLTGDNESSAKSVSDALGLDGYSAGILPDEKQGMVKEFQDRGEFVAMVGDGINDAPALAQADVGIAIGSGTDIAGETADIILVNSDPRDVSSLILFGRATYRKMVQNLFWATGYNIFAIPLAAGILAGEGILLSPATGAVLMSLSTIIVAINAKSLKI